MTLETELKPTEPSTVPKPNLDAVLTGSILPLARITRVARPSSKELVTEPNLGAAPMKSLLPVDLTSRDVENPAVQLLSTDAARTVKLLLLDPTILDVNALPSPANCLLLDAVLMERLLPLERMELDAEKTALLPNLDVALMV